LEKLAAHFGIYGQLCAMKSLMLSFLACLAFANGAAAQTQDKKAAEAPKGVFVSDNVLKTAKWAKYPYDQTMRQAEACDLKSIESFLAFHGTVDGRDALDHATTCLELIPGATDDCFALAISRLKPKLKSVLLERLTLAQGQTSVEALHKPMAEWAPYSWAALNNRPIPEAKDLKIFNCMQDKTKSNEPLGPTAPSPAAVQPSEGGIRND
jgi:hypothetical protein